MDKKEKIWFSGVWSLLPSGIVSILLIYVSTSFQKLVKGGKGNFPLFSAKNIMFCLLFMLVVWAVVFAINAFRYFNGEHEFNPFIRKESTGNTTAEKRRAMQNDRKVAKYLSREPSGFIIGRRNGRYVCLPNDPNNVLHTVVIGSPGSKKSSTILDTLIYDFQVNEGKQDRVCFVVDIKPELQRKSAYFDKTGEKIRVINPASTNPLYFGWDVYAGLTPNSSDDKVEERADLIARSLIPEPKNSDNSIFTAKARDIMVSFLMYGFFTGKGFVDSMTQLLNYPLQVMIQQILSDKVMCQDHPKLRMNLIPFAGDDSELVKDAEHTMRENLRIFTVQSVQYMLKDNPRKASPQDLCAENPKSIFLSLPDNLLDQYRPLFNLIIQQTLKYLSSIPEYKRADYDVPTIWMLIDEFGSIGHMDIEGALARLRSRKVAIWMCIQGLPQLDNTYGESGRRSILTNSDCILVLGSKDDVSNKYFSEMAGNYEENKTSFQSDGGLSLSYKGKSESMETKQIFTSSDFSHLKANDQLVCFLDGEVFMVDKYPYFMIPKFRELSKKAKEYNDEILGSAEEE